MRIQTATISTKELQQALRDFCAANGGIPDTVIIQSYSLNTGGSKNEQQRI